MVIDKGCVVSIHYNLTNDAGDLLDTSAGGEPLEYLHGAHNLIPGLEKELQGKAVEAEFSVSVPAAEAYGEHDEHLVQQVPRSAFQGVDEIEVGMAFQASGENGQVQRVVVSEVTDEFVTVDANHPLAGQQLHFDVRVVSIRPATEEEVSHGHVHGAGCNH